MKHCQVVGFQTTTHSCIPHSSWWAAALEVIALITISLYKPKTQACLSTHAQTQTCSYWSNTLPKTHPGGTASPMPTTLLEHAMCPPHNLSSHQSKVIVLSLLLHWGMLGEVHQVSTDGLGICLHVDGLE